MLILAQYLTRNTNENGIRDIEKFRVKEGDKREILQGIDRNIRDKPSKARKAETEAKLDLQQTIFNDTILLEMYSRYGDRTASVWWNDL